VGSLTHSSEYCAAAVTADAEIYSIGIDAESHRPLPEAVLTLTSRDEERRRLADLRAHDPRICWDTIAFSAKESVYKAWYPLTRRWLGFEDVSVHIDPDSQRFTADVLIDGLVLAGSRLHRLVGRYSVDEDVVLTAIAITRGV
jgi:4'-phosphopantetheinyl transferase EntD